MNGFKTLTTLACAVLMSTAALAAPGGEPPRGPLGGPGMGGPGMGPPMEHNLFPPELILMNQLALGLTADQLTAVKKLVNDTHGRVLDFQIDLHRVTEQLQSALDNSKLDEPAVLALASQAMDLEKQIKTAHLSLMIKVKNLLTPEQQEKARALEPRRGMGPGPGDE